MSVSGSKGYKSGIVSLPNRVTIRDNDDRLGSYPTISRTGDFSRNKPTHQPYDDEDTLIFGKFNEVVFGKQIISGSRYSEDLVATPNTGPTLSGSSRVMINVSDDGIISGRGGWQNLPIPNDTSPLPPFDDSRMFLDSTTFYMSGTSLSIAGRDFQIATRDKIQIKIDLDTPSDKVVTRYDDKIREIEPRASTEFENKTFSGFCYYNFQLKRWEDIGVNDSYTSGKQIYHFFHLLRETTSPNISRLLDYKAFLAGGNIYNNFKPYQFSMSNHSAHRATNYNELFELGYDKIGHPTMMGLAPYKYWYAATSSLYIDMKDYISHPFVLEKAVIEIPVNVRRKNSSKFKDSANTFDNLLKVDGSNRDIDNYVFFIYRQSEDPPQTVDEKNKQYKMVKGVPVSRSKRFLVLSASAAFYNSRTFSDDIVTGISTNGLPHSPSFSHDFNMKVSGSNSAEGDIGSFEGRLRLEASPAIPSRQLTRATRFPVADQWSIWDGTSAYPRGSTQIQDYWPGSTTATSQSLQVVGDLLTTNYEGNGRILYGVGFNPTGNDDRPEPISKESRSVRSYQGQGSNEKSLCKYYETNTYSSTPNVPSTFGYQASNINQNIEAPYILLPTDKIIIGVDGGISSTETYRTGTIANVPNKQVFAGGIPDSAINVITGSRMVIRSGHASITLFGSLIKNETQLPYESNQNITSDALHEPIMEKVVDQFDIERNGVYRRGYLDRYMTGSVTLRSNSPYTFRGIDSYFIKASSNSSIYLSGSFTRFRRFACESERIFDTVMPAFSDFGKRSGFGYSHTGNEIIGFKASVGRYASVISGSYNRWSNQQRCAFPYYNMKRPRIDGEDIFLWIAKRTGPSTVIRGWLNARSNSLLANQLMHQVGHPQFRPPRGAIDSIGERQYRGASHLRYGIYGIRKNKTSCVFRSDRYGQFRDMLEQRIDTKYYEPSVKQGQKNNKTGLNTADVNVLQPPGSAPQPPRMSGIYEATVQIKFVAMNGFTPVNPYNTNCVNCSTEASSSLPYFEGEARNIPPDSRCPRIVSVPGIQFMGPGGRTMPVQSQQVVDFFNR